MSTQSGRKAFDNETLRAIGARIKAARGQRTQDEFAELIGVSRSALTNYEAGRRLPNDLVIKRISEVAGLSEPDILFGKTVSAFAKYKDNVNAMAMAEAQKRPGYIPRFMVSDDEYAFIALFRLMAADGWQSPIIKAVLDFARNMHAEESSYRFSPPVHWGEAYVERLEAALGRGELEPGFDPDFSFWVTFWEECLARAAGEGDQ